MYFVMGHKRPAASKLFVSREGSGELLATGWTTGVRLPARATKCFYNL